MEDKFLGVSLECTSQEAPWYKNKWMADPEHPFRVEVVGREMEAGVNTLGSSLKEEGRAVGGLLQEISELLLRKTGKASLQSE